MKLLQHFFALALIQILALPAAGQNLTHFYDFDETTVLDRVGGVNGTLYNGSTLTTGSVTLDGIDDYVEFNSKIIPTTGTPFSLFIKYVAGAQGANITELISQGYSGGPGFYIGQVGNVLRLTDNYGWGETQTQFSAGAHQLLLTSGTSGTQVFIDGILVFSSIHPLTIGDDGSGTNTRLGRQFGSHAEWFNGSIDQLKVFDQVVSYSHAVAACPRGLSEITTYAYDALGRLVQVNAQNFSGSQRSSTYAYDAAGNRTNVIMQSNC